VQTVERALAEAVGAEKRSRVQSMFAAIAPTYDHLNTLLTANRHHAWRAEAVAELHLSPGDAVLDLCTGTGDFLTPLRRAVGSTGRIWAVDYCEPMLVRARPKADATVQLVLADAGAIPLAEGSVDAVTVGWGIRNVPDIDATHREIYRVLKPGGRFVSVDTAVPTQPVVRALSQAVSGPFAALLGRTFGHASAYDYLAESTQRFWSRERLASSMEVAGFTSIRISDRLFGNICLHFGTRPLLP
jgi:demethylmenaquinone methyltransferase/2-methoxy-6-polyprenyl-1,4-benzoquinol methylase